MGSGLRDQLNTTDGSRNPGPGSQEYASSLSKNGATIKFRNNKSNDKNSYVPGPGN